MFTFKQLFVYFKKQFVYSKGGRALKEHSRTVFEVSRRLDFRYVVKVKVMILLPPVVEFTKAFVAG